MKTFAILLLSSLTSMVSGQANPAAQGVQEFNAIARDLITPVAVLHPRATTTDYMGYSGDCAKSFTKWLECTGEGMDEDLCGLDLMNPTKTEGVDQKCACDQATALYNCYTSYCSSGTEASGYYIGVSYCASIGFGTAPPAPTGAAATDVAGANGPGKPNAAGPTLANDVVLWTMWAGLAVGSFVVMLL